MDQVLSESGIFSANVIDFIEKQCSSSDISALYELVSTATCRSKSTLSVHAMFQSILPDLFPWTISFTYPEPSITTSLK